jgi:DNA-binding protein H-NS
MIDLLKLDFAQLKELGQQVAQQIAATRQREVQRAGEQIQEMAKSLDMSVQELLEQTGVLRAKLKKEKGASSSGVKGQPLYRNPDDASKTWTGRGRLGGKTSGRRRKAGGLGDQRLIRHP